MPSAVVRRELAFKTGAITSNITTIQLNIGKRMMIPLPQNIQYLMRIIHFRCKKCEKSFKLTIDLDNHNCSAEVPAPPKPPTPKPPQPPLKVEFSLHPKTMRQMAVTKAINDQMKKIEKSSKSFRCPKCPKLSFNSMALLTAHIRATHNFAEHQCRICGNDYVTAGRLKGNIDTTI